ncbi:uncharacterized protein PHA67_006405 isoform 1-T1 [Liasis olivaceus]
MRAPSPPRYSLAAKKVAHWFSNPSFSSCDGNVWNTKRFGFFVANDDDLVRTRLSLPFPFHVDAESFISFMWLIRSYFCVKQLCGMVFKEPYKSSPCRSAVLEAQLQKWMKTNSRNPAPSAPACFRKMQSLKKIQLTMLQKTEILAHLYFLKIAVYLWLQNIWLGQKANRNLILGDCHQHICFLTWF